MSKKPMQLKTFITLFFDMDKGKRLKQLSGKNKLKNLEDMIETAKANGMDEAELNPARIATWLVADFNPKEQFAKNMKAEIEQVAGMLVAKHYAPPIKSLKEIKAEKIASAARHLTAYTEFLKKKRKHDAGWFNQMYTNDSDFRSIIDDPTNYGAE